MNTGSIRIAGIVEESIVDGPGIRFTVFTQGCAHNCKGCHNTHTHDYNGGKLVDIEALVSKMRNNPLLDGLTLSGGEPFDQPRSCAELARAAAGIGLGVWAFSGYTYEEIVNNERRCELLYYTDVLVDGRFLINEKTSAVKWRGSKNQRIIDVAASLEANNVILYME